MRDWSALSLAAVGSSESHLCQSATLRLHCIRSDKNKRHFNMETWGERQSVTYANFSFITFFTDNLELIYGDISLYNVRPAVCTPIMQTSVWHVCACVHAQVKRTVYQSYGRMIVPICHSFFPPDRHSVLICIQHLRLRMFNAAIKLISDIKCICD